MSSCKFDLVEDWPARQNLLSHGCPSPLKAILVCLYLLSLRACVVSSNLDMGATRVAYAPKFTGPMKTQLSCTPVSSILPFDTRPSPVADISRECLANIAHLLSPRTRLGNIGMHAG